MLSLCLWHGPRYTGRLPWRRYLRSGCWYRWCLFCTFRIGQPGRIKTTTGVTPVRRNKLGLAVPENKPEPRLQRLPNTGHVNVTHQANRPSVGCVIHYAPINDSKRQTVGWYHPVRNKLRTLLARLTTLGCFDRWVGNSLPTIDHLGLVRNKLRTLRVRLTTLGCFTVGWVTRYPPLTTLDWCVTSYAPYGPV